MTKTFKNSLNNLSVAWINVAASTEGDLLKEPNRVSNRTVPIAATKINLAVTRIIVSV